MRFAVALVGISALLFVACGYPDPSAGGGAAATTDQTTPTPAAGMDDFLCKPLDPVALRAVLARGAAQEGFTTKDTRARIARS